ncbi:ornithine decarboxylase-like [Plectropomus leopardus]|uniref:ornithine decarboxylase-like n=1 Tax=Plectropomus leopardus TaxID=160734 RepID=UPI001C4ACC26|nr:ornithine decarboxylase-like [Plectropomus leopardus]
MDIVVLSPGCQGSDLLSVGRVVSAVIGPVMVFVMSEQRSTKHRTLRGSGAESQGEGCGGAYPHSPSAIRELGIHSQREGEGSVEVRVSGSEEVMWDESNPSKHFMKVEMRAAERQRAVALFGDWDNGGLRQMRERLSRDKSFTNYAFVFYCIAGPEVPSNGSAGLSPENWDILDNGRTISDFIDGKIKERSLLNIEEPFHVADLDSILRRHHRWVTNLPRVKPFYAVKCNNTAAVLKMMTVLDTGFDCASKGEIQKILSLGVSPNKIIYAHTTKPMSHLRYACAHGVDVMTFDNEDELLKVSLCHPKAKLVLRIAVDDSKSLVRLNSKFGARLVSVGKLLERAGELGVEVIGVSFHVGSGCTNGSAFRQAIVDARHVFDVGNLLGFQMRLVDIGGGFSGIGDFHEKFEEFSDVINGALDELFPPDSGVQIIAEPGRFYVESAFTLAVNVIAKRVILDDMDEHDGGEENSRDRMMIYYINEGVYGSLSCIIFDPANNNIKPYPHRAVESSEQRYRAVIWGPTCDSIDKITEKYWMPECHVGDWLLIENMGAYSVSVVTDFNSFERAHIYPVVTAETWRHIHITSSICF